MVEEVKLEPCPFCRASLTAARPVDHPRSGCARFHPGDLDDGTCPIAGWGFYDEQLAAWNRRAAPPAEEVKPVAMVRVTGKGYGMSLATYIAYALPEGDHWLYAAPPATAVNELVEALEKIEGWEMDWSTGAAQNLTMVSEFARAALAKVRGGV